MTDWSQQCASVNALHRDVFGYSDDIGTSESVALHPRPPSSRSTTAAHGASRRPPHAPTYKAAAKEVPPTKLCFEGSRRPTGGLASAKRLVFCRAGTGGQRGVPRAHPPGAELQRQDVVEPHGARRPPRYARRGSGATRRPDSAADSSDSFVSSASSAVGAQQGEMEPPATDETAPEDTGARSVNRFYVAAQSTLFDDGDGEGSPPLVGATADRRAHPELPRTAAQTQLGLVDTQEEVTVGLGTVRTAEHAPSPPPRYAPSPWNSGDERRAMGSTELGVSATDTQLTGAQRGSRSTHSRAGSVRQTLLHWAEAAGIRIDPPAAYAELSAQAAEDVRVCAEPWRRFCVRGRATMRQYGVHVANLRDKRRRSAPSGRNSLLGITPDGKREKRQHFADPNHSGLGVTGRSVVTSMRSLRSFRYSQAYGRWCEWQLLHFFEQGPAYLGSVWRHRDCGTIMQIPDLIDGRYSVPTDTSIGEAITLLRRREHREKVLRELLLREHCAAAAVGRIHGNAGTQPLSDRPRAENDDSDGEAEAGTTLDTNDEKASYADVRFDPDTGLLTVSLYVDAPGSDETGTFLHSFLAGCLDGFRWLVLTGPWKRQVLFLQPLYEAHFPLDSHCGDPVSEADVAERNLTVAGGGARRVCGFHSFCARGVVFSRDVNQSDGSAKDPFVCTRCGHIRSHNPAYVTRTGALARGTYYCWVCRHRTSHIRAPPSHLLALRMLVGPCRPTETAHNPRHPRRPRQKKADAANLEEELLLDYSKCSPEPPKGPRSTVSANLRFLNTRAQWNRGARPEGHRRARWNTSARVNPDLLLGAARTLGAAPPKPSF